MKIVHAADLHIDSPLRGLERYEGAPVERVRGATRRAFERVIEVCLEQGARFLVLAGDVFDGDWKDVNTGLFFVAQLRRLREIGCEVLLLRGNHDFELTRALDYPDYVHEFSTPKPRARERGKRSHAFERDGVVFHGVSYPTQSVPTSLLPEYPAPTPDLLNIGVLHTNATGSVAHAPYAPCSVSDLAAHGYGYWALGHVHTHAILSREPWIVYPGNTQGRHAREAGAKGCVVIEVEDACVQRVELVETDVMRFFVEEIRLAEDDDRDDLIAKVRARVEQVAASTPGRICAIRLEVVGNAPAHAAVVEAPHLLASQIRSDASAYGDDVWIEKVRFATGPVTSLEELRAAKGLVGELLRHTELLRTTEVDGELLRVAGALDPLRKKLERELEELQLDLRERDFLLRVLGDAEALLAQKLTELPGADRDGRSPRRER